jgi:hypothetical protein
MPFPGGPGCALSEFHSSRHRATDDDQVSWAMNPLLKSLRLARKSLFYLILFFIGSRLYVHYMEESMPPANINNLPAKFAVLGSWHQDHEVHCQVFYLDEMPRLREKHPDATLKILDQDKCSEAIFKFEESLGTWPVTFDWQAGGRWHHIPHAIKPLPDGVMEVEVTYSRDDDDFNKSRYRLKKDKMIEAWHKTAYGPGVAIAAMVSGLGLALVGLVAVKTYRVVRKRAEKKPPNTP